MCNHLFDGPFCEIGLITTPPLPVLYLFKISAELAVQLYDNESPLTINVDPSIDIWPVDGNLNTMNDMGFFSLTASREGIFKVKYDLRDDTYDT